MCMIACLNKYLQIYSCVFILSHKVVSILLKQTLNYRPVAQDHTRTWSRMLHTLNVAPYSTEKTPVHCSTHRPMFFRIRAMSASVH